MTITCNKCGKYQDSMEEHYWHMKLHVLELEEDVLSKAHAIVSKQLNNMLNAEMAKESV